MLGIVDPRNERAWIVVERCGREPATTCDMSEVRSQRAGRAGAANGVAGAATACREKPAAALRASASAGSTAGAAWFSSQVRNCSGDLDHDLQSHVRVLRAAVLGTLAAKAARLGGVDDQAVQARRESRPPCRPGRAPRSCG